MLGTISDDAENIAEKLVKSKMDRKKIRLECGTIMKAG